MAEVELHGSCPVVATPFTEDGEIDQASLRNEVNALAAGGNHAIVLFGVVSEFFKLSDSERYHIANIVAEAAHNSDIPLVISVTHDATEIAVEWAKEYEDLGANFLMIYPPSRLNPGPEAVCDHLEAVANAVSIPVMVQYRRPENPVIPPRQFAQLSRDVENIRYFKIETDNTGTYVSTLLEKCEADVLVGRAGYHMIDILDRGGVGVIPAASFHEVYVAIYEEYLKGNRDNAIELHSELLPALNAISQAPIPLEKQVLARRGIIETPYCRPPVHASFDDSHLRQLWHHYDDIIKHIDTFSATS